jgi:hypothetical protein
MEQDPTAMWQEGSKIMERGLEWLNRKWHDVINLRRHEQKDGLAAHES